MLKEPAASIPRFIVPHFTVLHRYCLYYRLKAFGNLGLCWASLSVPYCQQHLLSWCLSHVLVIPQYFRLSHYFCVCCGALWSVIIDTTIVIVWGSHKLPRKMTSLIHKWCVLTAPPVGHHPSPRALLFLSTIRTGKCYWIRPVSTPTTAFKGSGINKR